MSPTAQRIAIAYHLGWKPWTGSETGNFHVSPTGRIDHTNHLAEYLKDLNAMHEAEKVLCGVQRQNYFHELTKLAGSPMMSLRHQQYLGVVIATAQRRAEAFLRTLGKWVEDAPASAVEKTPETVKQPPATKD